MSPSASEVGRKCLGIEVYSGKLLLACVMRLPDLEVLGVMRPLGS